MNTQRKLRFKDQLYLKVKVWSSVLITWISRGYKFDRVQTSLNFKAILGFYYGGGESILKFYLFD